MTTYTEATERAVAALLAALEPGQQVLLGLADLVGASAGGSESAPSTSWVPSPVEVVEAHYATLLRLLEEQRRLVVRLVSAAAPTVVTQRDRSRAGLATVTA